ncbi:hypothetical protein CK203_054184 [Vitis vinifera]|uniref:Nitroreductase domain-containing protein n=1 Tax=Vitis vinifera TaxID=29760 RepID=A0A438FU85_VITVI|nr:hypothetical protein CK203_054184 [Vitis vinifera]
MSLSSSSPSTLPHQQDSNEAQVLKYHNQTKHSFTNYARGPRDSTGPISPNPFADSIQPHSFLSSTLRRLTKRLRLTPWKTTGFSTWSLRVNPAAAISIPPSLTSLPQLLSRCLTRLSWLIMHRKSILWREAWKYGERAFRYCNHDVGHAIAAVSMAAAELGWDVKRIEHGNISIFGTEVERKPNVLSREHICWDIIYRTAEAVKKPLMIEHKFSIDPFHSSRLFNESSYKNLTVSEVVRKRRSAVDMDGVHVMQRDTFIRYCYIVFPQVAGLPSGLYFLVRNEDHFDDLKKATRSNFKWAKPEGCPDDLPLYELTRGDFQELAKRISCHQDIAGDGCFSLGMVAHLRVLYLEAHAVGISATGIGCYFDDAVHELLGLRGSSFQSLYHFTVGGPVLDKRIMSLPAYPGPAVDS